MDNGLSGRLGPNVLQLVEMVSKQGHGPVRARPPWTAVTTVNRWAVTRSSKPRSDPSVSETQLVQVGFFYVGIHELFEKKLFCFSEVVYKIKLQQKFGAPDVMSHWYKKADSQKYV